MPTTRNFTVFTPSGDWRNIFADSPEGAKRIVFNITLGRIPLAEMSAEPAN